MGVRHLVDFNNMHRSVSYTPGSGCIARIHVQYDEIESAKVYQCAPPKRLVH
jgi:hypothetical protein